ncbi:HTH-type transcriptional regulator YesS [compost metagenome]
MVRQYIAEHFRDPNLSLAQIGEQFGMNQKTLSRIFKEEFGEKFVDYLTRLRLELAKEMLEKTQDSVQSISEYVGYLYPMSFIRVFKKVEGVTPGDYRKEREARAAEGR